MKSQYENITRYYLPRRTYMIIRCDGKSFYTYTKGLDKPYDTYFNLAMDVSAKRLLQEVQGGLFVYTQSDEISVVAQDFVQQDTQAWFGGNLQKICSVSASIVTANFNQLMYGESNQKLGYFDARVFTIADPAEVANYFVWRTRDCVRNSINLLGQSYFSAKQLHQKNTTEVQEMLHAIGVNWNAESPRFKTGSLQTVDDNITISQVSLYDFYKELLDATRTRIGSS